MRTLGVALPSCFLVLLHVQAALPLPPALLPSHHAAPPPPLPCSQVNA